MAKLEASLEAEMQQQLLEKKRKAEQELEVEMRLKKLKLQEDLERLEEEKISQQNRLAELNDQLQERMVLISSEQETLDELRDLSKEMQSRLQLAGAEADRDKSKQLLRQKLEDTVRKQRAAQAPVNPALPANAPAPEAVRANTLALPSTAPPAPAPAITPSSDQRITSANNPQAWHQLYRMTKKPDSVDKEIYDAWHAGLLNVFFTHKYI